MCKMCPKLYYMIILINKDKHMTYKNKRERERERRVKKAKETYKERERERETCKERKRDI